MIEVTGDEFVRGGGALERKELMKSEEWLAVKRGRWPVDVENS